MWLMDSLVAPGVLTRCRAAGLFKVGDEMADAGDPNLRRNLLDAEKRGFEQLFGSLHSQPFEVASERCSGFGLKKLTQV